MFLILTHDIRLGRYVIHFDIYNPECDTVNMFQLLDFISMDRPL